QHRRRPRRGAHQGREPQSAGAQRLLRSRDALLGHRVRDGAPRHPRRDEQPHQHEVLRGGPHDVRAPALDRQDEARHRRLHGPDAEAVAPPVPPRRAAGAGAARQRPGSTICARSPGWLSRSCSAPPCSFATASTIASPSPTPGLPRLASPRKKRSVALGLSASAMPGPSSATEISTAPSARRPTCTLMAPCAATHLSELSIRLLSACASSTGSPATCASPPFWKENTTPFSSAAGS